MQPADTRVLESHGVSPRINSPYHPEASGVIERFNTTFKNNAIHDYGRQWQKAVPCLVWALREVPNRTTSVSPTLCCLGMYPGGRCQYFVGLGREKENVMMIAVNLSISTYKTSKLTCKMLASMHSYTPTLHSSNTLNNTTNTPQTSHFKLDNK